MFVAVSKQDLDFQCHMSWYFCLCVFDGWSWRWLFVLLILWNSLPSLLRLHVPNSKLQFVQKKSKILDFSKLYTFMYIENEHLIVFHNYCKENIYVVVIIKQNYELCRLNTWAHYTVVQGPMTIRAPC